MTRLVGHETSAMTYSSVQTTGGCNPRSILLRNQGIQGEHVLVSLHSVYAPATETAGVIQNAQATPG